MTAFFLAAPVFSFRTLPTAFKVGLGFFSALVAFSTVATDVEIQVDAAFIVLIVKEAVVGLALGFVAALLLYTLQIAGGFIDFQMGFAIANVVDPQTGAQVPIIGNFKYVFSLLFLLSVNGHHLLIDGVIRSYQMVPVENMFISIGSESVALFITELFVSIYLIAFQIAIPIVGSLFLVDVAMGLIARTVPQLNVFVVGIPLKIFVGFLMIFLTLGMFFYLLQSVLTKMIETMGQLLQLFGG
ncbi:flagellar biosynthetic protein FliR [Bacillus horti]|uniref:Flagellar biosynthetic protein FliR n=2 Tax=Caldalkalibacillus horti TaxID=77523 RepID=A0ABT9VUK9_9BACI|nr:flagellar biosynthetic protein FliR [Bacillus horti]